MATRQQLDDAKAALASEIQTVVQAVNDLRQQIANGTPITDADIQDLQNDLAALQGTTPQPQPAPGP